MSQRQRKATFTAKGRTYNAERRKAACRTLISQLKKLQERIESNSRQFDNVHLVQNDLQVVDQLNDELEEEYQSWLSCLDNEDDVRYAHRWYEERHHGIKAFIAGMKDWVAIAKDQIEEQLERSPSEQASLSVSQQSSRAVERARLAELTAQSTMLEKKQALRNQMERLEIEEKIAIAKAREQAMIETEIEVSGRSGSKTVPTYLPSQARDPYSDEVLTSRTVPDYLPSQRQDEYPKRDEISATFQDVNLPQRASRDFLQMKNEPATPRPRLEFKPTPPAINVSPIPSSVTTKVHQRHRLLTDTYSPHKECADTKQESPTSKCNYKVMSPQRISWKFPSSHLPHRETTLNEPPKETSIVQFLDRQNMLTEMLTEQHQRSLLPPLLLSTFTNDPVDFNTFMSNFEAQIESKVHSNDVRLRYLEQYLDGEAKELIKRCQHKEANVGYPEAKKLLKDKYGDPYKISSSYIHKAAEWPTVSPGDNTALERLSTFLTQCVSAMESMSYLTILDHPQNLQNLVRKLPLYLQDRWRRRVVNIRESHKQVPGFKYFADFVKTEAKVATDPIFSKEALEKAGQKEKPKSTKSSINKPKGITYRTTSYVTNAELPADDHPSQKCILCNGIHDLDDCKQYRSKTLAQRKALLTEKQVCYACYGPGHRSRGCAQKRKCSVCQGRHPTGLHDYNFVVRPKDKPEVHQVNSTAVEHVWSQLPIVPVRLKYMDHHVKTYAMLDSCITGTFITDSIRKQLKAEGNNTKILVGTVNGRVLHDTKVITGLKVSDLDGKQVIELPRTFTRDEIPASENNIPKRESVRNWQHLKKIADYIPDRLQDSRVGLLIGTNCPKAMEPKDVVPCPDNGPYAVLTFAGWTVVGPCHTVQVNRIDCNRVIVKEPSTVKPSTHHVHFVSSSKEVITPKALNNMMDLEFNERKDTYEPAYSQDDKHFLKILQDGIKKENGHYIMPLPFRRDEVFMPNNKEHAISRAMWLKKRLTNDQKMYADYLKFMEDILDKDYARKVPSTVTTKAGKTWYLPHHGVYHPHKPEKIRVVFDCSARFGEVSLNSELLQGPVLTSSLVGVLTRFRKEPVAFQADIEAMFHQVRVCEEHRDFLRFLWWPKGDLSQNLEEYQMNVHLFGAISSPSCANFAVQRTADDAEAQVGKETADVLRKNFYVDDCLRSEESDKKATERVHGTIHACKEGGFHLTKVSSNSRRVLETIPEDDRSKEVKGIDLSFDNLPVERALGVQWHIESDAFGFKITLKDKPLTRRGILSTISSVYDPLGFAAPVLLPAKRILQELCKSDIDWDDPISEEYSHRRSVTSVVRGSIPGTAGFKFTSSPPSQLVVVLGKNTTNVTLSWQLTFDDGNKFSNLKMYRLKKSDQSETRLLYHDSSDTNLLNQSSFYSKNISSISKGPSTGYVILTIKDIMRQPNNEDGSLYRPLSEVYVYRLTVTVPNLSKDQKSETEVLIYFPPRVLHITPDQWMTQGSNVPLQCNATGDPQPTLYWTNNTSTSTRIMSRSSVVTLNITGKQSEGQYCCVAVNRFGNYTACTFIHVIVPPRVLYSTPDQWMTQGSNVPLQCNATGYPQPTLYWTKNTSSLTQTMSRSSVMTLNITGKQSEGQYCCVAVNRVGNDTACTIINVTEYQPINTTMTSSKTSITKNDTSFNVTCTSDASPAAVYTFYQTGRKPFNSSDGRYSTTAIFNTHYENITCVPINKYGTGPNRTISLPIYGPPLWYNTTTTYSMINTSVTIACKATGNPTPVISWTNTSRTINQSSDGTLTITYKPCLNKTLEYYCMASNVMGSTSLRRITVRVNSLHDCAVPTDKDVQDAMLLIIIVIVVFVAFVVITTVGLFILKKKRRRKKDISEDTSAKLPATTQLQSQAPSPVLMIEESPYGEPIDAISPPVNRGCYGDYATVQDVRIVMSGIPGGDDRMHAGVMNSQSPKKKSVAQAIYAKVNKNKPSKDQSDTLLMTPLYEEIPGRKSCSAARPDFV